MDLSRRYTLFDWSRQADADPLPVVGGKGLYFETADGRRFLDFNSQLMCVNAGHGEERIAIAIAEQAKRLAYISPFHATEVRALLGSKLASLLPGDIDKMFFTLGGADANENAIKFARIHRSAKGPREIPLLPRGDEHGHGPHRRSWPMAE